jgi:hypothetical protein
VGAKCKLPSMTHPSDVEVESATGHSLYSKNKVPGTVFKFCTGCYDLPVQEREDCDVQSYSNPELYSLYILKIVSQVLMTDDGPFFLAFRQKTHTKKMPH